MDDAPSRPGGAYGLHLLVNRLDARADRILRGSVGLTYPRFLLLVTVEGVGPCTQRRLAEELGISEPTVSRTVTSLAEAGLLTVTAAVGQGHRRTVELTEAGRAMLATCLARLENGFDVLLDWAGVDGAQLDAMVHALVTTLDATPDGPPPGAGPPARSAARPPSSPAR